MKSLRSFTVRFALFLSVIAAPLHAAAAGKAVILATTTSTQDSGLLDVLIPVFERQSGYLVKTIAVGSGQALKMAELGEADVLLVHSPDAEKKVLDEGFVIERRLVMHNDFIIVGPPADPAHVQGSRSAAEAFGKIAGFHAAFISRGDDSGTNALEIKIWKAASYPVQQQTWYQQTGLGMGQTLNIAAEKKGYTLTDRGTYRALQPTLGLSILFEGDPMLLNVYHVMQVNPARWTRVNAEGARAFDDFMVSGEAQELIRNFKTGQDGAPLFTPDAGNDAEMH